jgi:carboxyl-terminal processing protease
MNLRFAKQIACMTLLFIVVFPENQTSMTTTEDVFEKNIYIWSKTMAEVFHLVHTRYYQAINPEKSMIQALTAFVKTLDPHSNFMDPKGYKDIMETAQGEFPGIGVQIDNTKESDDEFLRIIDTIPSGPAFKAGLLADDKIVEIDNELVKGLSLEETIAKLKGTRGTQVKIKVQRAGTLHLLEFTITRDLVKEQNALCFYFKDQDIYYLLLTVFTQNAITQMEQLLKKMSHSKGFILDLRNNSGGLLNSVQDIAGFFMQKNTPLVTTVDRNNKIMDRYATTKAPIANKTTPLFILVNNYTASAAEILAGALQLYAQEHNLAIFIVGSKTFGKGSVQEVIPLSNDCALKITIALYALSNNTFIQGIGITPDFEIEQLLPPSKDVAWFNTTFGRESALKNSIKLDSQKNEKIPKKHAKDADAEKSWFERKKELIAHDNIITSAVRLIELLDVGRKTHSLSKRKDMITFLTTHFIPSGIKNLEEIKI